MMLIQLCGKILEFQVFPGTERAIKCVKKKNRSLLNCGFDEIILQSLYDHVIQANLF